MSTNLTVNGVTFAYPDEMDEDWGPDATDWAIAVTQGMLQKAGGLFTLSADADFGASFGLKSLYYKSRTANPSATGQIRFANTDTINFRNAANSADLTGFGVNSSNQPTFDGATLQTGSAGDVTGPASSTDNAIVRFDSTTGKLLQNSIVIVSDSGSLTGVQNVTLSGTVQAAAAIIGSVSGIVHSTSGTLSFSPIVNADIDAAAAIVFSKLASLTSAHILVGSAGNVATDVAVTGDIGITNAGVTSISSGVIVNADVSPSAAIAVSKLAALTASRAVVSDGSGLVSAATTTSTEIGYVNGVTSAIQTQIDSKLAASRVTNFGASAWTPTGYWTTGVTYTGTYRRVGDTFQGRVNIASSAATFETNPLTINLPSSHTIATSKLPGTAANNVLGYGGYLDSSTGVTYDLEIRSTSTTAVAVFFKNTNANGVRTLQVDSSSPVGRDTGDAVNVYFEVPIVEYA